MRWIFLRLAVFLAITGAAAAAGTAPGALAQPREARPPHAPDSLAAPDPPPVIHAAPAVGAIRVDGRLDEPAWATANPFDQFRQTDPNEGQPASERTEVRVLVDEDAVYVGARLFDRDPAGIRAHLARRDEDTDSDHFQVYFDSFLDHLTAATFRVNAAGALLDGVLYANGNEDDSWDAVWEGAASRDSLGWCVELRIPLSQLHYNSASEAVWGVQFERWIQRKQERDVFAFTSKKETGGVSRFGRLAGLGRLPSRRHLELLPYTVGRAEYKDIAAGSPFRTGHDYFGATGLDLKYDLTRDLSLTGTVNPDFGQAEVDPAVVNLSAYETFFPEKRPFFVEGAGYFSFGDYRTMNNFGFGQTIYSRRIGRPPHLVLDSGAFPFVDAPDHSAIAGAAKLTGKTRDGWTVGVMDAVTTRERSRYLDYAGARGDSVVEPPTNYFIGRVRRDLRGGDTSVGALLTAVNRNLETPDLRASLRSSAYLAGVDLNHAWRRKTWSFDAFLLQSFVQGSADAIAATQQSSAHYFQRPDQTYLHYDPTRTSLSGYHGTVSLAKNSGNHWLGSLTSQFMSPGYEVNDVGYETRANRYTLTTLVMYKEDRPGRVLRNYNLYPFTYHDWNYGGNILDAGYAIGGNCTFANYWSLHSQYRLTPSTYDDNLNRGGPIARSANGQETSWELDSDSRKPWTGYTAVDAWWNDHGGHGETYDVGFNVRPRPGLLLRFAPEYARQHVIAQYVETVADPTATATYGARYVFATLNQTTLSLTTRLDWTFSPRVSLQLYLQPLVSSGAYSDYKEFLTPGTFDFGIYGRDRGTVTPAGQDSVLVDPDGAGPAAAFAFARPDFNYRSLRGNAVLRWEYRPGSTLYLIWQQTREEQAPVGDFDFGRDFQALFSRKPDNIFMVKVTTWFGV